MRELLPLVVFMLGGQRFAVPLARVERAVLAAAVVPVPGVPPVVLGLVNVHGEPLPVFDARARFQSREPAVRASDQFLILRTERRRVAVLVDDTLGVFHLPVPRQDDLHDALPDNDWFDGVTRLEDDLVLVHDIEKFLSPDESRMLDAATEVPA
jgi:purine-binding chemotaxis protein CheW